MGGGTCSVQRVAVGGGNWVPGLACCPLLGTRGLKGVSSQSRGLVLRKKRRRGEMSPPLCERPLKVFLSRQTASPRCYCDLGEEDVRAGPHPLL